MFLYWILCVCLLVCLIALLVYLVGSFVGYLVGWLGLRSPVCLLVCLFTLYLLHYFVGSGFVFLLFFDAVPSNFRHGGGPGAARAYDNFELWSRVWQSEHVDINSSS